MRTIQRQRPAVCTRRMTVTCFFCDEEGILTRFRFRASDICVDEAKETDRWALHIQTEYKDSTIQQLEQMKSKNMFNFKFSFNVKK
jgi:hypothetical protein